MSDPAATVTGMPRVYAPAERPDVEVLVDGVWCPGELRMVHDDGRLNVQYRREDGIYLENFPEDHVRRDAVDRSQGRG